ncbi:MAG TPA: orotidine-5'-phosphate decarboxylase [Gemmatimonadaceae bacterium]|nr:orotidine-5'-phosphate decarboxylase [Gemmatimonadaceae bacterium]
MAGLSSVTPIVALDVADTAAALRVVDELGEFCRFYKIGSELFTAEGPAVVRAVRQREASVFLDLKFHDIPNTVRGAVRSACSLGVRLLTVHASGGRAMLEAASSAAAEAGGSCGILAVSVLTSMDAGALSGVWGRPIPSVEHEVLRLAELAATSGLTGLVCSGQEAAAVRAAFGSRLATLVPGIRLPGGDQQDQARVVTPRAAAAAGARYLVIGRAVTGAPSPQAAMKAVLADLP